MPRHKPPALPIQVQPPDLVYSTLSESTGEVSLYAGASWQSARLQHAYLRDYTAEDVLFDRVLCRHSDLGQCRLTLAQLLDSRFETCDLAASEFEKAYIRRCQFVGCRMLGTVFVQADLQDVAVQQCSGELCRFWECSLREAHFEQCMLRGASFADSTLDGAVFRHCDLTGANFRGASLRGADLRGSNLEGLQATIKELQGVTVDSGQAVQLAAVLGLTVSDMLDDHDPAV